MVVLLILPLCHAFGSRFRPHFIWQFGINTLIWQIVKNFIWWLLDLNIFTGVNIFIKKRAKAWFFTCLACNSRHLQVYYPSLHLYFSEIAYFFQDFGDFFSKTNNFLFCRIFFCEEILNTKIFREHNFLFNWILESGDFPFLLFLSKK